MDEVNNNVTGSESCERACDGQPDDFQMVPPEYQPRKPVAQAVEMARWPQMTTLMKDHLDAVLKILAACDECEVVTEVAASDSGNVKGNKWVQLHDVVFGWRDDASQGLISQFPIIPLPSKFKKKLFQFGNSDLMKPKSHQIVILS